MGLAASQARFLAITSRKLNCEFQSMQIAQEKLSISRDLQKISQEYQNSLNLTKLVWDGDGNNDGSGNIYDLSYDLMMTPSMLNDYSPYLITDTTGKIVLSEQMFNAAVAAGIIDEKTGDPTGKGAFMGSADAKDDGSRNAFLYQMGVKGSISSSTIDSIIGMGDTGYSASGIGGEILDKTIAGAYTTNAFIRYLDEATYPTDVKQDNKVIHSKGDPMYALNLKDILGDRYKISTTTTPDDDKYKDQLIVTKDGKLLSEDEISELTLGDLLNGNYVISSVKSEADMKQLAEDLLLGIAKLLGKDSSEIKGLNVDSESDKALDLAYEFTKSNYLNKNNTSSSGEIISSSVTNSINQANNTNGLVVGTNGVTAFSVTNLMKSFLTNFAIAVSGSSAGCYLDPTSASNSKYITSDLTYTFLVKQPGSVTETDVLTADFYNQLYNNICLYGASTDKNKQELVKDKNYLTQALKNGQLFISSLNTDGYFYQGHYTLNGYVAEIPDESAIAQAEAEYNVKKNKLNYKEETLDLKMKNIDTELSSLTTEYDTVKNLISKNVEKVFTMFSS